MGVVNMKQDQAGKVYRIVWASPIIAALFGLTSRLSLSIQILFAALFLWLEDFYA